MEKKLERKKKKSIKLDNLFWLKLLFLGLVVGGYISLFSMDPIRVEKVAVSTEKAGVTDRTEGQIYVEAGAIEKSLDGKEWIWIVKGDQAKKIQVRSGAPSGEYIRIEAGLLRKDAYLKNPGTKLEGLSQKTIDWSFQD